jgi:hypothetical protein
MSLHIVLLSCNGSYLISKVPKMTFFPTHTHTHEGGGVHFLLGCAFFAFIGIAYSPFIGSHTLQCVFTSFPVTAYHSVLKEASKPIINQFIRYFVLGELAGANGDTTNVPSFQLFTSYTEWHKHECPNMKHYTLPPRSASIWASAK